jgi:hypothetical protein
MLKKRVVCKGGKWSSSLIVEEKGKGKGKVKERGWCLEIITDKCLTVINI